MKIIRGAGIGLVLAAVVLLAPGCGTLNSVNNLATSIVNTAANTAVKALSPSTYTGGGSETYNSREPLKKRRNTLSSREPSKSKRLWSSRSKTDNPPVGMPYKSRNFGER